MPELISVMPDSQRGRTRIDREGNPSLEYAVKYLVRGDTQFDTDLNIKLAAGIPRAGFTVLNGMICKSVEAVEVATFAKMGSNYGLWEVEAVFDSDLVIRDDRKDESGNPTPAQNWTPDWSWSYEEVQETATVDWYQGTNPLPMTNALGEEIITEVPRLIPVLTISRYEVFFDPSIMTAYGNKVNSSSFWGAPENCALMMPPRDSISDKSNPSTGAPLRKVEYTIKFSNRVAAPNSWRRISTGGPSSSQWEPVSGLIGWATNPACKASKYLLGLTSADFEKGGIPFLETRTSQPTEGLIFHDGLRLIAPGEDPNIRPPEYYVQMPYRNVDLNSLNLGPF